jgi:hypothetical protein
VGLRAGGGEVRDVDVTAADLLGRERERVEARDHVLAPVSRGGLAAAAGRSDPAYEGDSRTD